MTEVVAELHDERETAGGRGSQFCDQTRHTYRFDWGPNGLRTLAPVSDVVVIVDVLRFTSAVSAAVESGCTVFPYRWADDGAALHWVDAKLSGAVAEREGARVARFSRDSSA